MSMENQSIEEIYQKPDFDIVKGSTFNLQVTFDKKLEQFYYDQLFDMIDHWTFPYKNQYVRPFRITEHKIEDNIFDFAIIVKKQIDEIDMLRLMIEDLLFAFNHAGYRMIKWEYVF
ncbi:hypothetical protein ACE3MZ_17435 [Paenibacillus sp. WLX1005]|uniref:hypothetical protein n=1 Tax=Paenibacillus sp. WLX1005 TaxID=3243766 RepID=UPI003984169D